MKNYKKLTVFLALAAFLVMSLPDEAEAQRRGGRSRARSGTYKRTNANGQTRQGTWSQQRNRERGQGYRERSSNRQVNTERGTYTRDRNSRTERTGDNTYQRTWEQTKTGPNGQSRTWSGEGTGTVERTDNGHTRTYQGTTTSPKGNEYNVDKTVTKTKTDDGWVKDRSKTVTDSNGNVVGTGSSTSTGTKGEGVTTEGSWTNHNRNRTTNYSGSSQRTEDGLVRDRTYTREGTDHSRNVRWQYVDGQWVRTTEGSNGSSTTTTIEETEGDN